MAGVMGEAFAMRLDPVAWMQASGAGSVDDLGAWLGVCCRDAGDVAERVAQLNAELGDLACQELSGAAARHGLCVTDRRR